MEIYFINSIQTLQYLLDFVRFADPKAAVINQPFGNCDTDWVRWINSWQFAEDIELLAIREINVATVSNRDLDVDSGQIYQLVQPLAFTADGSYDVKKKEERKESLLHSFKSLLLKCFLNGCFA